MMTHWPGLVTHTLTWLVQLEFESLSVRRINHLVMLLWLAQGYLPALNMLSLFQGWEIPAWPPTGEGAGRCQRYSNRDDRGLVGCLSVQNCLKGKTRTLEKLTWILLRPVTYRGLSGFKPAASTLWCIDGIVSAHTVKIIYHNPGGSPVLVALWPGNIGNALWSIQIELWRLSWVVC